MRFLIAGNGKLKNGFISAFKNFSFWPHDLHALCLYKLKPKQGCLPVFRGSTFIRSYAFQLAYCGLHDNCLVIKGANPVKLSEDVNAKLGRYEQEISVKQHSRSHERSRWHGLFKRCCKEIG